MTAGHIGFLPHDQRSGPAAGKAYRLLYGTGHGRGPYYAGGRYHPPRRLHGRYAQHDGRASATLLATTFEWADAIDAERAARSKVRAEEILAQKNLDKRDMELAEARLRRALVRSSVAARKDI